MTIFEPSPVRDDPHLKIYLIFLPFTFISLILLRVHYQQIFTFSLINKKKVKLEGLIIS